MKDKILWPVFYIATLLLGIAEGFFLTLSLYVDNNGVSEIVTGTLFAYEGIGALLIIPFASVILRYVKVMHLITIGAGVFTFSALGFWLVPITNLPALSVLALLAGAGFAVTYAVAPVTVSQVTEPGNTVLHFAILSAVNVIGMGIAPVIAKQLHVVDQLDHMWLLSAILSFVSGAMFLWLGRLMPDGDTPETRPRQRFFTECRTELRHFGSILLSNKRTPIIMVTIGGCVFTIMSNFQATFAESRGLDFSIYFMCYASSVILCRIFLAKALTRMPLYLTGSAMLALMCLALTIFQFVGQSELLYGLAAVLFGMGYGLAYPLLKAQVVDGVSEAQQASALVLFTFFFFAGTYLFPFIAGVVIVSLGYEALFTIALVLALLELTISFTRWLSPKTIFKSRAD